MTHGSLFNTDASKKKTMPAKHNSTIAPHSSLVFQVHIVSSFILNGVCCRWRGWLCLEKLEGVGSLELDSEMALREEQLLQRQIALVQQKLRECEEIYRGDYHVRSQRIMF